MSLPSRWNQNPGKMFELADHSIHRAKTKSPGCWTLKLGGVVSWSGVGGLTNGGSHKLIGSCSGRLQGTHQTALTRRKASAWIRYPVPIVLGTCLNHGLSSPDMITKMKGTCARPDNNGSAFRAISCLIGLDWIGPNGFF